MQIRPITASPSIIRYSSIFQSLVATLRTSSTLPGYHSLGGNDSAYNFRERVSSAPDFPSACNISFIFVKIRIIFSYQCESRLKKKYVKIILQLSHRLMRHFSPALQQLRFRFCQEDRLRCFHQDCQDSSHPAQRIPLLRGILLPV